MAYALEVERQVNPRPPPQVAAHISEKLPLEIRSIIWAYAFELEKEVYPFPSLLPPQMSATRSECAKPSIGLLAVDKTLTEETRQVLYTTPTFRFRSLRQFSTFVSSISAQDLCNIKHFELEISIAQLFALFLLDLPPQARSFFRHMDPPLFWHDRFSPSGCSPELIAGYFPELIARTRRSSAQAKFDVLLQSPAPLCGLHEWILDRLQRIEPGYFTLACKTLIKAILSYFDEYDQLHVSLQYPDAVSSARHHKLWCKLREFERQALETPWRDLRIEKNSIFE